MKADQRPIVPAIKLADILSSFIRRTLLLCKFEKQRVTALFLFVVLIFSIGYPSGIVIAAAYKHPTQGQINKNNQTPASHKRAPVTPVGKINMKPAPAPAASLVSSHHAATDAMQLNSLDNKGSAFLNSISKVSAHEMLTNPLTSNELAYQPHELTNQRAASSTQFLNKDGSITQYNYFSPHFYQKDGGWATINTTLVPDDNAADSGNLFGQALGFLEAKVRSPKAYTVQGNSWLARFTPSDFGGGMVRIKQGSSQIGFSPVNANTVDPTVTTDSNGQQTVHYDNLWPGVNVDYIVESDQLKEAIILQNRTASSQVQFKVIGADLQKPAGKSSAQNSLPAFNIQGALDNQFSINPANLILNNAPIYFTDPGINSQFL